MGMKPELWTARPIKETVQVYTDWADAYDSDVNAWGYVTPDRIAAAMAHFLAPNEPILDFGCGTGLSGQALRNVGLGPLHGCDITEAMVDQARDKDIYENFGSPVPAKHRLPDMLRSSRPAWSASARPHRRRSTFFWMPLIRAHCLRCRSISQPSKMGPMTPGLMRGRPISSCFFGKTAHI